MASARTSDWLSAAGWYQDLIADMCQAIPGFQTQCETNIRREIPWPNQSAKLVVLEAGSDMVFTEEPLHNPPQLEAFLATEQAVQSNSITARRRVFILQGIHPAFVALLGAHFNMDPSFFLEHERFITNSIGVDQVSDTAALPGTARMRQHYTFKYYELVGLPKDAQRVFGLCCAVTGRHIGVSRVKGRFSDVGIVRRKCSIWRRASPSGPGWDCIILTDPPLETAKKLCGSVYEPVAVPPLPYQGGYLDFMPSAVQMEARTGPPRTSMLEDLSFYLRQHSRHLTEAGPDAAAIFAKKIVAAHYKQLSDYVRCLVSSAQFHMMRRDTIDPKFFGMGSVEAQWSDAQALERRMSEYCEDMDAIMLQCGVPLAEQPDVASCAVASVPPAPVPEHPAWHDCAADFQVLRLRLQDVRRRSELLNPAIAGLAGMASNRQALREAKSAKALTFVGLVFIPLAYTASLFSMAEPYGPGQERFWIYLAVSVPFIFCVLGLYAVVDMAYGSNLSLNWLLGCFGFLLVKREKKTRESKWDLG